MLRLIDQVERLADGIHRAADGVDLHACGIVQNAHGELFNLIGHRGGEKQRLPLGGQLGDHALYIVDKAHVQHPVRLVQHENLDLVQVDITLSDQVVEPAGGGDQDLRTAFDLLNLPHLAYAAEHHAAFQRQVLAVQVEVLLNLDRQFARGGENQRAGFAAAIHLVGKKAFGESAARKRPSCLCRFARNPTHPCPPIQAGSSRVGSG